MESMMTKAEETKMLEQIWVELRYVRQKLDSHVEQQEKDFQSVKGDVSEVKAELVGHKVKLGLMFSGIGFIFTGIFAWIVNHIDNLK